MALAVSSSFRAWRARRSELGARRRERGARRRPPRPIAWLVTRLTREGRALFCVTCATLVFSADPSRTQAHVLVLSSLALLTAALVFTRAYRLEGVRARAHVPPRVTVGDEITFVVELSSERDRDLLELRVEAPPLPWDGTYAAHPRDIERLSAGGRERTAIRARFSMRGARTLEPFRVARRLPLGLTQGSPIATAPVRFVVVPRVARVTSLDLVCAASARGGAHLAAKSGDTSELLGVRPYRMGDPMRDLHARSWARHGAPMVREYQSEQLARVALIVDSEPSRERAAELEAALALAAGVVARASRSESPVDVLLTNERVERLGDERGSGALDRALDVLAGVRKGARFAATERLAALAPHLPRVSSAVVVALEWEDEQKAFARALRARGVGVRGVVVGAASSVHEDHVVVPLEAIQRGEELAL